MKESEFSAAETDAPASASPDRAFLGELGQRVRRIRALRGMSRKALAVASGVSERYLAQLESGEGNLSIVLLRRVARATGAPIEDLSPLSAMPLEDLQCDFRPESDTQILRGMKTLKKINGKPVADFWKMVAAKAAK